MAVYGRNREKWDPTKIKSKVSKNNTYELKTTTVTNITSEVFDLKNTVWTHFTWGDGIKWASAKRKYSDSYNAYPLNGYENRNYSSSPASWVPDSQKIELSRFGQAINFGNPPSSVEQSDHYYVRESEHGHYSLLQLFGDEWEYSEIGTQTVVAESRYLYFSYWIYLHKQNSPAGLGNDGHTFAQLSYNGSQASNLYSYPVFQDPNISFYVNSSGVIAMRFTEHILEEDDLDDVGYGAAPGEDYIDYSSSEASDCMFVEIKSSSGVISVGQWHHVTFALKFDSGWDATAATANSMLFVDGRKTSMATPVSLNPSATFMSSYDHLANFEWQFGSLINSYGAYDHDAVAGTDIVKRSSGFSGALGEFTVISQDHYSADATTELNNRTNFAKFLWEAQREGAYHLHSGVHSSSPRLEQLDLDRDSLYPSNFTLQNYTRGSWETDQSRVSKRSTSRFTEGYNSGGGTAPFDRDGETWQENASQYFINSNKVMPHLRLNPADTILTNGNWYSDARSEFFPEDLDQTTGFVVTNQTSDELYREHHSIDTAEKFHEIDIPEAYKDCFVIDIPLPNTAALLLGTDRQSVHSSSAEESRITSTGAVNSSPDARISNMAYYNFASSQWETLSIGPYASDRDYGLYAATPTSVNFVDQNDIGFSPMTGLIVPTSEEEANKILPLHGQPTSDYGFPFSYSFIPESGQTMNLSKYIDVPVVLAGWEIKTKVIPAVGFPEYTTTNQDTNFGFSVGSSGKSPFHYGGHGESAVYFNHNKHMTGYNNNIIINGSDQWHVGNTVPVTKVSGTSEVQPTEDTEGLVTSGITAFLLRKPKLSNPLELRDNYHQFAKPVKYISKFTNLLSIDNSILSSWSNMSSPSNDINEFKPYGTIGFYPVWSDPGEALWSTAENQQLLGWLQHVYHNDQHAETYDTRQYWIRENDTENAYRSTSGKSIINMLGKENVSYIQDLLYSNTAEVDMHVSGAPKQVSKITDGIPVTNFFIAPKSPSINDILIASDGTQPSTVTILTGTPEIYEGSTNWESAQILADIIPGCGIPSPTTTANEKAWLFSSPSPAGVATEEIQVDISGGMSDSSSWTGMELYFQFMFGSFGDDDIFSIFFLDAGGAALNISINSWYKTTSPYSTWSSSGGAQSSGAFLLTPSKTGSASTDGNMNDGTFHWLKVVLEDGTDPVSSIRKLKISTSGMDSDDEYLRVANLSIGGIESVIGNLGIHKSSTDNSIKWSISTMSDSSINLGDTGLGEHSIIPRYASADHLGTATIPRINIPTQRAVVTDSIDAFHKTVKINKNPHESSTVILNPNDDLILGLQNSVSTAFASQQINKACNKFIKWGRTSLTIPVQNNTTSSPYLRLYVKNTREDKTFNFTSSNSKFNQNVNQTLGDQLNCDLHETHNSMTYSGSMADDIIGPTYFTAPEMKVTYNFLAGLSNVTANSIENDAGYFAAFDMHRQFHNTYSSGFSTTSGLNESVWSNINWNAMGMNVFATRGQNAATVKYPAITWHDYADYDKNMSGGHGYPWFPLLEMFMWVVAKDNPNNDLSSAGQNASWSPPEDRPRYSVFMGTQNLNTGGGISDNDHQDKKWYCRPVNVCALSELNTNTGASATGHVVLKHTGSDSTFGGGSSPPITEDVSRVGRSCPGNSAWYFKCILPIFYGQSGFNGINPAVAVLVPEFRLCHILEYETSSSGTYRSGSGSDGTSDGLGITPTYDDPSGTKLKLGDAFYFKTVGGTCGDGNASHDSDRAACELAGHVWTPIQHCIRIKTKSEIDSMIAAGTSIDDTQRWSRGFTDDQSLGPVIHIVAGCLISAFGIPRFYLDSFQGNTNPEGGYYVEGDGLTNPLQWGGVFSTIHDVLDSQQLMCEELLYTTTFNNYSLELKFPNDPILRKILTLAESAVNEIMDFKLCNVSLSGVSDPTTVLSTDVHIYHEDNDSNGLEPITGFVNHGSEVAFLSNLSTTHTQPDPSGRPKFYTEFWNPLVGYPHGAAMWVSFVNNTTWSMQNPTISYADMPNTVPVFSSIEETYNEVVDRRIDRFVQRRSTEKKNMIGAVSYDPSKPQVAGPFGSLKNLISLSNDMLIFDSLPSATISGADLKGYCTTFAHGDKTTCEAAHSGNWVNTDYMTLLNDIPQEFPFEASSTRLLDVSPKAVKVKMNTVDPGGYHASTTSTVDVSYDTGDSTVGDYDESNWGHVGSSTDLFDTDGLGLLNITNYIEDSFKGNSDFSRKSSRDLLIGFGNGVQGRHTVRPALYDYYMWTDTAPLKFAMQWIIDQPRGARFGQYNTEKFTGTYKFSYSHYGHLRDMLEQSIDTKYISHGTNERVYGSPVVISAINIANPEIPKLMENTSRYNKTANATVVKPYIENNYEATVNPINLNSESLRVDVAGSIRTKGITSPGNMAGNIRSRG